MNAELALALAEQERRRKAMQYEAAQNRLVALQRTADNLAVSPVGDSIAVLERLIEASSDAGNVLPAVSEATRNVNALATETLRRVNRDEAKRLSDLDAAEADLQKAKDHVTSLEQ